MPPRIAVAAAVTGGWAEIAVSDEGIGIAATERARVFECHYRTASRAAGSAPRNHPQNDIIKTYSQITKEF